VDVDAASGFHLLGCRLRRRVTVVEGRCAGLAVAVAVRALEYGSRYLRG
jgi:hypothetical protein